MDTKPDTSSDDDSNVLNEGASLEYDNTATNISISPDSPESPSSPDGLASDSSDKASKDSGSLDASNGKGDDHKKPHGLLWRIWNHFNIYILLFLFLFIIAGAAAVILYVKNRSTTVVPSGSISQQNLPSETLQELAKNGVQVGDPKQVLNIQSNSVFAGAVLVKGELQIAGGLKIGTGSLAIPELNVSNGAIMNQLQAQSVNVAGTARANDLTVLHNLNVNGSGSFNGGLTAPALAVGKLQLNGDLQLTRHIAAGGATPGRSNGSAVGSGGTTSVSGSDTAGSVTINTGSGPAAGCFITVNFSSAFNGSPHIVITPVGSAAAGLTYYINRNSNNFSICTTTPAPGNTTFGFDYHAFE